ncbi:hypothetical protein N7468_002998 [Penicillium chermesinum]|uniref:Serine peptidase n=1 Tax=Penicillium chermesinum TaxID=63820 RepID=A0A9W9P5S9_9EURO|nr:uncharacterized protein N7468_002998 [Penicillium chermesinum]KAJ5238379.1 hypothetical protein N7468_002998 [Penicillium chermesinum]
MFARLWLAVALLAARAIALSMTTFRRDVQLLASMDIDPTLIIKHGLSTHALAEQHSSGEFTAQTIEIPIDHTNQSVGTYQNRYWVSDQYYREGGPVFLYDVGETNASSPAKAYLGNSSSFLVEVLKEFGGMGIVWEHRYYGQSLPFPVNNATPPEHFQYLTNKQALADLPYFADRFSHPAHPAVDFSPSLTPWVMIGGSYAGMRSAFARDEYPGTFYASWASSAPVEARIDMSVYFDQVYNGLVGNGYSNCTKDIKAGLEYVDGELSKNGTAAADIKKKFFGEGAEKNSNGDFTAALAAIMSLFQAYGTGGGEAGIGGFCNHLETDPETSTPAGPSGFAPTRGTQWVGERFASWPVWIDLINSQYQTNCNGVDPSQPLSCVLNPPPTDSDTISWTWQYCTEFGYFQSNNFGPHSLLSKFQTLEYQQEYCYRQFPEAVAKGLLPKAPQVDATNAQTGGWNIRPSNVYWSGGPSIAPKNQFTTDVPQCNVNTPEHTVFGYVMPNAEHCFDFRTTFAPAIKSRQLFYKALHSWLPCFNGGQNPTSTGSGNGTSMASPTMSPRKRMGMKRIQRGF